MPPDVDLDKEERDPAAEEEEDTARREYAQELAKREKELARASREMPALPIRKDAKEGEKARKEVSTAEVEVDDAALVHMLEEDEEDEEDEEALPDLRPRVLIIEGDAFLAAEISNELVANGYATEVIPDGKEVVKTASVSPPALILLCVELPGLSGYLVCNQLKKHPELQKIPLILMSAEATTETFKQHKKLPTRANGYLTKPFQHDALLNKVAALTSQQAMIPPELDDDEEEQPAALAPTRAREGGKSMDTWLLLVLAIVVLAGAIVAVYFLVF